MVCTLVLRHLYGPLEQAAPSSCKSFAYQKIFLFNWVFLFRTKFAKINAELQRLKKNVERYYNNQTDFQQQAVVVVRAANSIGDGWNKNNAHRSWNNEKTVDDLPPQTEDSLVLATFDFGDNSSKQQFCDIETWWIVYCRSDCVAMWKCFVCRRWVNEEFTQKPSPTVRK